MPDDTQNADGGEASATLPLPQYQCHKKVRALKIAAVDTSNGDALVFDDGRYGPLAVSREFIEKHDPQAGGYFVVYEDGYQSFSPADAFENGYALIADEASVKKKKA